MGRIAARRTLASTVAACLLLSAGAARAHPGDISTIAGTYSDQNVGARAVRLGWPVDVVSNATGDIYIADEFAHVVRRVDVHTGQITTAAGNGTYAISGDGGPALDASAREPSGVAIDHDGNLLFSDRGGHRVRRVDGSTGIVTTIAGNSADQGTFAPPCVRSGDGGPATHAGVCSPAGLAVDHDGNIFIADGGSSIRRIDAATGVISTVAGSGIPGYTGVHIASDVEVPLEDVGDGRAARLARLLAAEDVAVDAAGNLFIAEALRIRKVDASTGIISTVAGTGVCASSPDGAPATSSAICNPRSVSIDPSGAVVFADTNNSRVRRIDPVTQTLSTIAGDGTRGFAGDGAPVTGSFSYPFGIAFDPGGRLLMAAPILESSPPHPRPFRPLPEAPHGAKHRPTASWQQVPPCAVPPT